MSTIRIKRHKRLFRSERIFISLVITVVLLAVLTTIYLLFGRPDGSIAVNRDTPESGASLTAAAPQDSSTGSPPEQTVAMTEDDIHRGNLILVNAKDALACRFLDDDKLVSIFDGKTGSYNVYDMNVLLSSEALASLNQMMDNFYRQYHTDTVNVACGYRTFDEQQALLDDEIAEKGPEEAAQWVTQPGYSEHHTGLAIDLSLYHTDTGASETYDGTGIYAWLNENAYRYGYIVRYEDEKRAITGIYHEPWHFRYVGVPHAYIMKEHGLCLEEYIAFLKDYRYEGQHLKITCAGTAYEIYYTDQMDVPVPSDRDYVISGNNVDGFIVTVSGS